MTPETPRDPLQEALDWYAERGLTFDFVNFDNLEFKLRIAKDVLIELERVLIEEYYPEKAAEVGRASLQIAEWIEGYRKDKERKEISEP